MSSYLQKLNILTLRCPAQAGPRRVCQMAGMLRGFAFGKAPQHEDMVVVTREDTD